MGRDLIVYVDVDDTLVRTFGTKRMPIAAMIEHVRKLHQDGATLYGWSTAGANYVRASAEELGIAECFVAFLPKPHVVIDDQAIDDWRFTRVIHPNRAATQAAADYAREVFGASGTTEHS